MAGKKFISLRCIKWYKYLQYLLIRVSSVDREDLKPYRKSEKSPYFYRWLTILFFTLLTTERRLIGWQFLTVDLSATFLNTGTTYKIFKQSRKQDSLKYILKSGASIYESLDSNSLEPTPEYN